MAILCMDVFAATTVTDIPNLAYPAMAALEGVNIQRFAMYNNKFYAEYIFLDTLNRTTSFTPAAALANCDVYIISQGRAGSAGSATAAGAGGGAGTQATAKNVTLGAIKYICYFTSSSTIYYNPGGSNIAAAYNSSSFTGTYQLYGDANYSVGTAGTAQSGTTYTPGRGASGCTFLQGVRAPSTVYPASSTTVALLEGASGIGAGGNGGARTDLQTTAMNGLTGTGAGAGAMIMIRVPIG